MIHYEIEKPEISSRFDVDDIRALRVWSSMRWKDANFEEIRNDIAERAKSVSDKIGYVFDPNKNCYVHYPKK
ncbi:MAG: hypothetical protein FWF51_08990 [Chitinivibrionia bacterium]|nr:hypothetical protein [Chitinivibrionia bacterium]